LDTRKKIRLLDEFIANDGGQAWTAALGVFDPFTIEVARDVASLATAGRKLLVVVSEAFDDNNGEPLAGALLGVDARARMLAALRAVDTVVIASAAAARDAFRRAKIDIRVEEDPAVDRQRSKQFVQYLLDRQASACGPKT
jgi:glycerol-3-phosphate cytidylyltransferase-like family protein